MDFLKDVNKKYKIIRQLGRAGERSVAYLCESNDKVFVVKGSVNNNDRYVDEQRLAISKKEKMVNGYCGNICFPNDKIEDEYIISDYLGIDFSKEVYDNLSSQDKVRLEKEFADFLLFVHSKERFTFEEYRLNQVSELNKRNLNYSDGFRKLMCHLKFNNNYLFYIDVKNVLAKRLDEYSDDMNNNEIEECKELLNRKNGTLTLTECIECFKENSDNPILKHIVSSKQELEDTSVEGNMFTLIHGDIRNQNLLYDKDSKKLSVIDFETSRIDNVYKDFVPYVPASFGISYDFLFNVIKYYNEKSDYKISQDRVIKMHEVGMFYEFARNTDLSVYKNRLEVLKKVEDRISKMRDAYDKSIEDLSL